MNKILNQTTAKKMSNFPLWLGKQQAVRTICWARIAKIDFVSWSGTWKKVNN